MNRLGQNTNPVSYYDHSLARGLIHNETPNVRAYLQTCHDKREIPVVYCGFDPSAESLQIGNLQSALMLRRAQIHGVKPIVLLGGATGLVGDPSGKKAERTLMDKDRAEANLAAQKAQLAKYIDADKGNYQAIFANNHDWFRDFHFLDFLRDVGKHITINYMIAKESVKQRMETGISYTEFAYMLVQGYDFLHLFEKYGCRMQVGGSDQWGNMTTGIELIRRKHSAEVHCFSAPLLTDAAGNKLGKTESGAIYLNRTMTSPYQFYQFCLNVADADVPNLLKRMTLLDDETVDTLINQCQTAPEKREAQKALALHLTELVHSIGDAEAARDASQVLFSKDASVLTDLKQETINMLESEVPSSRFTHASVGLLDLLVETGLCKSKGEARRHVKGNAVSIDRVKVHDENHTVDSSAFASKSYFLLGLGKNKLHLVIKA